ncbi:MAG: Arm DNA-binding domain-containing protein, partial [Mesorhizobium sp.]
MPLSDAQLRTLKKGETPRKLSDGGGLHVLVTPQGGKLWRLAYRYGGKQKLLALGAYPVVSLSDARARRDEAKRLLGAGLDPSAEAKADKVRRKALTADTFEAVASEFLSKVEREGKAEATLTKKRWLVGIANASLGKRPLTEIAATEILVPLRKVEGEGNYETARRLRAVIGQVFRYAIST